MQVLKFGGSSVRSSKNIKFKLLVFLGAIQKQDNVICVVSAVGGITDKLLKAGQLALEKNDAYVEFLKILKIPTSILYQICFQILMIALLNF